MTVTAATGATGATGGTGASDTAGDGLELAPLAAWTLAPQALPGPALPNGPALASPPQPFPAHIVRGGPDTSMYQRPAWIIMPAPRYELQGRGDLHGGGGSMRVGRWGVGGNLIIGPETDLQISIPVDYEQAQYRLRGPGFGPGGAAPLRNAYQWVVAPNIEWRVQPRWFVVGAAILTWAGQYDASFDDAARYGGFAGAKYVVSDTLNFTFGVTALSRLENDAYVFPLVGFEWAFAPDWRLYTEGNELRLEYDATDWLTLKTVVGYEAREYRLDARSPLPGGVFRDTRVPIWVGVNIIPHPAVKLSAAVGFTIYQQLQIDNAAGSRFAHPGVKPAPVLSVALEFTF